MIDTNALLAATFAVIAQFHATVNDHSPQTRIDREDIQRLVIGTPASPLEVFVQFRKGSSYNLLDGSVCRYVSVNSYSHLQNPQMLSKLMGPSNLNSNEVFKLAAKTIERLAKHGNPMTNGPPKFGAAGQLNGGTIPFYGVTWPLSNNAYGHAAMVEIDARNGEITYLHLPDRCFKDYELAQEISNRVYTPGPPAAQPSKVQRRRVMPYPPTNEVIHAVAALSRVCNKLGMTLGSQTNVACVDWERSCSSTNAKWSATIPFYQIAFTNGAWLTAFNGAITYYSLPDKYFDPTPIIPHVDQKQFFGRINKRWQDLAKDFEDVLKTKFGFPEDIFSGFKPITSMGYGDAPIGAMTLTRIVVIWLPFVDDSAPGYESKLAAIGEPITGFAVEFDLQSGEIKSFGIYDPRLVEIFTRHQKPDD